ncbi:hypothetical protein [Achromobacter xylosoxidans]|uniref:hypothetical protein n=1 Tax=Alcaligenes xylosoxydans xylosoxydans TaxID=85698 RepID=UPI001ED90C43|nr:hypothetical protein [Achromobacter xylosoxidans]
MAFIILAMIPIALPSAGFYIFLSLGFLAGLVLLGWALVLIASKGGAARRPQVLEDFQPGVRGAGGAVCLLWLGADRDLADRA